MLEVDHDNIILPSTPFPAIPMLGKNCCCDHTRCCIVLYLYCACAAIRGASDNILVGYHTIGLLSCCLRILPVAKAVNVCQLGEKLYRRSTVAVTVIENASAHGPRTIRSLDNTVQTRRLWCRQRYETHTFARCI